MRQKKKRLEERPEVSKYAKKHMDHVRRGLVKTGASCPPPHVINREAQAYLRREK